MARRTLAEMMAESEGENASGQAAPVRRSLSEIMAEKTAPRETPDWIKETLAEPEIGEPTGSVQILPEGRWNVRNRQWEPSKPVMAQFKDLPGQPTMTASQLQAIGEDTKTRGQLALAGGYARGLTSDFADEAAGVGGAVGSIIKTAAMAVSPASGVSVPRQGVAETYRTERDEARRAMSDVQEWSPGAETTGRIAGIATQAALGIGGPKGGPLLTLGNTGRATAMGAAVGLGESKADLTKGEVLPATWDAAKGAAGGVAANTFLGVLGKGATAARNWVKNAPERAIKKADDALIDSLTLGAPAAQRDKLMGELGSNRPDVLAAVKSNPQLLAALKSGDRRAAAEIVMATQRAHSERVGQYFQSLDAQGEIEVAPVIKGLEKHRDELRKAGTLEGNFEADKVQKRIDAIEHQFMPPKKEPELHGEALASKLISSADKGTVERAATNAADFGKVADKYKLGKVANDLVAKQERISSVLETLNKKTAEIYDRAGKRTVAAKPRPEIITSQSYLDPEIVARKLKSKDFEVLLSPEFTYEGKPIRIVLDGHHSLEAARLAKVKPTFVTEKPGNIEGWDLTDKGDDAIGEFLRKHNNTGDSTGEWVTAIGKKPVLWGVESAEKGADVYVANVTGKLREWADDLRKQTGGMSAADAANVDKVRMQVSEWAAAAGTAATGSKTTMTPKELREFITNIQGKAFAGSYLDPNDAKAMQRQLARKMREVLDDHMAKHGRPSDVKKLETLNKQISALIAFQESAERESVSAFKGLHQEVPTVPINIGTGKAKPSEIYAVAKGTEDQKVRQNVTGSLYDQLGTPVSRDITAMDKRGELLEDMRAPLAYTAARDASPPTTLRSHAKTIGEQIKDAGVTGGIVAGTATAAAGAPATGFGIVVGSIAAKYGKPMAEAAERAAVTMEYALRNGAKKEHLAMIGRAAKLPPSVTSDLIEAVAPQEAARAVSGKNKR